MSKGVRVRVERGTRDDAVDELKSKSRRGLAHPTESGRREGGRGAAEHRAKGRETGGVKPVTRRSLSSERPTALGHQAHRLRVPFQMHVHSTPATPAPHCTTNPLVFASTASGGARKGLPPAAVSHSSSGVAPAPPPSIAGLGSGALLAELLQRHSAAANGAAGARFAGSRRSLVVHQ